MTVDFTLNGKHISVTRGLFNAADVRAFTIDGTPVTSNDAERSQLYQDCVTVEMGLSAFEQFVFLQHFVFTFDEARKLIFWDDQATALTLYLCFGGDPAEAERADRLQREAEQAGSRGRNAQFQVNNTRKRIAAIEASLGGVTVTTATTIDLDTEYESLEEQLAQAQERQERVQARHAELENDVTQYSAAVAQLRVAYTETFNQLLDGTSKAHDHPIVIQALQAGDCGICSTNGANVVEVLKRKLSTKLCPLCESPLDASADQGKVHESLALIDEKLADARVRLEEAIATRQRLSGDLDQARVETGRALDAMKSFERNNGEVAAANKAMRALKDSPVARTLESLRAAQDEFSSLRDAEYSERDRLRGELIVLQEGLERRYALAEETFVPRFKELAELFLGINLDISVQAISPIGMKFVVELRGSARQDESQMSESQRFFVDIALRMALVGQMARAESPATLLVDTPEGSLDIAYENRAGEMFARFVEKNNSILMTANINSSKLLTTLARRCGAKSMRIEDMTGWTELSEVQQKATDLFEDAFREISAALSQGPAH